MCSDAEYKQRKGTYNYLPSLLVVGAVDEHTANIAHRHDALRGGKLRMQGVMLLLEGLSLLGKVHTGVYIAGLGRCSTVPGCRRLLRLYSWYDLTERGG